MADAVLLPGGEYGAMTGMLLYVGQIPESRGATLHRHAWHEQPARRFEPASEAWVRHDVEPVLDRLGGQPLLIGKSFGTNAAGLAADRSLPAVWLTPLLHAPWVVAGLERATAPMLLVGGTADRAWDTTAAHRLTPHVLEVEGAGHGMQVPGRVRDTVDVLARVVTAINEFLDTIAWPPPSGRDPEPSRR